MSRIFGLVCCFLVSAFGRDITEYIVKYIHVYNLSSSHASCIEQTSFSTLIYGLPNFPSFPSSASLQLIFLPL